MAPPPLEQALHLVPKLCLGTSTDCHPLSPGPLPAALVRLHSACSPTFAGGAAMRAFTCCLLVLSLAVLPAFEAPADPLPLVPVQPVNQKKPPLTDKFGD